MGDVLDEAYGIVQCKECPWYKSCAMPMRFTAGRLPYLYWRRLPIRDCKD